MPLMSKAEKKKGGDFKRKAEEVCFHQCQRGRLLEMLSLMEKGMAKVKTGATPKLSIRQKRQRGSKGSRSNKGIRDRAVELKSSVI